MARFDKEWYPTLFENIPLIDIISTRYDFEPTSRVLRRYMSDRAVLFKTSLGPTSGQLFYSGEFKIFQIVIGQP